jgi:hypothetical protein
VRQKKRGVGSAQGAKRQNPIRIIWQRLNRGACIPRIAKVVNPVDIARVGAGVHASRCGQAGLPTIAD